MQPRHVYVHVPFCARRCSYCDFAIAIRKVAPVEAYLDGVWRELSVRLPDQRVIEIDTLYLGGGTPSRLGAAGVGQLLSLLGRRFQPVEGAEVTLEANPDDVTVEVVRAWRAAGINRVSLGVQSFDDGVLAWMHRTHDAAQIGAAIDALRAGGIGDWSLDLIYALPPSLARDWERDVRLAIAQHPPHLSLYGLTVEQSTPLARWIAKGDTREADDETHEGDFLRAHELLAMAGYDHYEVSNYALPGSRARHNSSYWRGVPYFSLGPGAHGFDGASRRWNERAYARWLARVRDGEDPVAGEERLNEEQRALERVYLGLRTTDGLLAGEYDSATIREWIEAGWARVEGGRVILTPLGWLRLDSLAADLTEARSRY